jgi:hypothetical protein
MIKKYTTTDRYINENNQIFYETIILNIDDVNEVNISVLVHSPNNLDADYGIREHITCFSDSSMYEQNDTYIPTLFNRNNCLKFIINYLSNTKEG